MKTVIILSPHFPPSTLAGVHRARHLAKHLPRHGWRPVVIRAAPAHEAGNDLALARLVPATVRQVATGAIPAPLARRFGIGDIGLRAYRPFATALLHTAAAERADAVLITGGPFYPLLLARLARRRLGLPVVLDFQDPWVSADGASRPPFSKAGLAHRLAVALEPLALRHADMITSVSEGQNAEMAARHPLLDPGRMAAIPIGGDPDDFFALAADPGSQTQHPLDPARKNLTYVGTYWPRAEPALRTLFAALARLRANDPALAAELRLNFVGTSARPDAAAAGAVTPLAAAAGVADLVTETARRIPFLDALGLMARSDGQLLFGSDEPHYTASKIYPTLMSGTPYLSLFHAASSAHAVLAAAGGGLAFAFAGAGDLAALEPALADGFATLARQPQSLGRPDPAAYAPFTADAVAARFAAVLDRAAEIFRTGGGGAMRPAVSGGSPDPIGSTG